MNAFAGACRGVGRLDRAPTYFGLALIWMYQRTISPLLGPRCRYYPSCSHYGYTAVERYGLVKGSVLTGWRILRCNPWSVGGIDDVPLRGEPLFGRRKDSDVSKQHNRAGTVAEER